MMTVLRLHYNSGGVGRMIDVRPSDVDEITAENDKVLVEVSAGPRRDNYSYLATHVEFAKHTSDSDVPLQ